CFFLSRFACFYRNCNNRSELYFWVGSEKEEFFGSVSFSIGIGNIDPVFPAVVNITTSQRNLVLVDKKEAIIVYRKVLYAYLESHGYGDSLKVKCVSVDKEKVSGDMSFFQYLFLVDRNELTVSLKACSG